VGSCYKLLGLKGILVGENPHKLDSRVFDEQWEEGEVIVSEFFSDANPKYKELL